MTRQIPLIKERLRKLNRPASISEIGEGLDIPERTLRRWLGRLVDEGYAESHGEKKGRRYTICDNNGFNHGQSQPQRGAWSAELADHIGPVTAHTRLPRYEANQTSYLSTQQRARLRSAALEINFSLTIDEHAVIEAAFHSGRLDANQCSHSETERLWYEGLNDHSSPDRDQVRSLNQLECIRDLYSLNVLANGSDLLSGERLRSINYLLSDGLVDSQYQGIYRRMAHESLLGGESQDSNMARQVRSLLNLAQQIEDPFEQSLFLLTYLTRIAPFHIANAATARAFANLPLLHLRLPPLLFSQCSRSDYEAAFSLLLEKSDISGISRLFVLSYEQDCQHYKAGQHSSQADTVRIRYRQQRRHLIRDITAKPGQIESFKLYIGSWAKDHIPESQRPAFIQETINDLARLAPFNLAAFGISDEQWQQWRQYCVEHGIRFKTQKLA